jgi:hypothetical protein
MREAVKDRVAIGLAACSRRWWPSRPVRAARPAALPVAPRARLRRAHRAGACLIVVLLSKALGQDGCCSGRSAMTTSLLLHPVLPFVAGGGLAPLAGGVRAALLSLARARRRRWRCCCRCRRRRRRVGAAHRPRLGAAARRRPRACLRAGVHPLRVHRRHLRVAGAGRRDRRRVARLCGRRRRRGARRRPALAVLLLGVADRRVAVPDLVRQHAGRVGGRLPLPDVPPAGRRHDAHGHPAADGRRQHGLRGDAADHCRRG